jgi:hypothetical protein
VIALLAAGQTAAFAAPSNDDYSAATVIDTSTFVTTTDTSGATSDPSDPVTYSEAPPNDDFADAIPVGGLPYADNQDYRGATREEREPQSCSSGASAWYSYTPTTTGSVTARTSPDEPGIAVYLGSSLPGLALVGCSAPNSNRALTFVAQAGRTYLFQVLTGAYAEHEFRLDVARQPTVDFSWADDPTTIDAATFSPSAFDPGDAGFSSYTWDFGDGATSTETYGMHLFSVDGDYTVKLTVRTGDGRTASVAKVVQVRTHDVAIVRVAAPPRARVGQTIKVDVDLRNTRYPEEVEVSLYRNPWISEELVGSSTRKVGVKTTRFSFRYTVTRADRAAGEITFRATAALALYRDAVWTDNELSASPLTIR